jgi:hypothetical protein
LPIRPGDLVLSYMSSGQLDAIRIYFAALNRNKWENYCLMPTVTATAVV